MLIDLLNPLTHVHCSLATSCVWLSMVSPLCWLIYLTHWHTFIAVLPRHAFDSVQWVHYVDRFAQPTDTFIQSCHVMHLTLYSELIQILYCSHVNSFSAFTDGHGHLDTLLDAYQLWSIIGIHMAHSWAVMCDWSSGTLVQLRYGKSCSRIFLVVLGWRCTCLFC